MFSNQSKEQLPEGFKSWKEYNKARKEKKRLKQEYHIKKLEEKKRKAEAEKEAGLQSKSKKACEDPSSLSIAVPGSILDNAQSVELRTYLAGQIARAACVFKVDEVVVYDDIGIQDNMTTKTVQSLSDSGEIRPARKCCAQLARILQYLECPQYLRKEFFPKHKDLEYAGLLNPLDAPHHMRQQDDGRFREGVVINQPAKSGSYVNVGLLKNVKVDLPLQPGVRVTVEMLPSPPESKRLLGRVVPPTRPKKETGVYWGYSVRLANSLNTIFTECPYKEGYDITIGTSERGQPVEKVALQPHQHLLVVFGGLAGIEAALEADDVLTIDDPALIFDHYLNTCPDQGSRTIRTEEAILITLAELRSKLNPKVVCNVSSTETEAKEDSDSDISLSSDEDLPGESKEEVSENGSRTNDDGHTHISIESGETDSASGKAKKRKKSKDKSNADASEVISETRVNASAKEPNHLDKSEFVLTAGTEELDSSPQKKKKKKKEKQNV